jgi:hypothetical protein
MDNAKGLAPLASLAGIAVRTFQVAAGQPQEKLANAEQYPFTLE